MLGPGVGGSIPRPGRLGYWGGYVGWPGCTVRKMSFPAPVLLSSDERQERLEGTVSGYISSGYRVESQTPHQAIVVKGRRPNHLLHLILSVLTLGLWMLFVWLPLVVFGGEKRRVITVDPAGNVRTAKGRG